MERENRGLYIADAQVSGPLRRAATVVQIRSPFSDVHDVRHIDGVARGG